MTQRTKQWLKDQFQQRDPQDFTDDLVDTLASLDEAPQTFVAAVTFESSTFTLGTVPANAVIQRLDIARTTKWDAITAFEIGKSGDTTWLSTTAQANLTGAISGGESQEVETLFPNKGVDDATAIVVTINQGAATQGSGFVVLIYTEETQVA